MVSGTKEVEDIEMLDNVASGSAAVRRKEQVQCGYILATGRYSRRLHGQLQGLWNNC